MSTPIIGRNGVIRKDGTDIGYAKGVTVGVDAELIKDYQMGDDKPAILESGNKTFPVSIDLLYIDNTYASDVLAGTKVEIIILPAGSVSGKPKITVSNVVFNTWELTQEQEGVVLETVSGEGASIAFATL